MNASSAHLEAFVVAVGHLFAAPTVFGPAANIHQGAARHRAIRLPERNLSAPAWTASLQYQIDSNNMVYFNQRGSFRSGNLNGTAAPFTDPLTGQPANLFLILNSDMGPGPGLRSRAFAPFAM